MGPSASNGFSNAPLSKTSLYFLSSSSILASLFLNNSLDTTTNTGIFSPLNRLFSLDINRIFFYSRNNTNLSGPEIWRFLTHQLLFSTTGELIFGSILLYNFRLFERQMGSRKFGSFLTVISFTSTIIEIALLFLFNINKIMAKTLSPSSSSPSSSSSKCLLPMIGPYSIIYALFVLYFLKIPKLHPKLLSIFGVNISNKTIVYLLGLQLMISNGWASVIPSVSGLLAGLLYVYNPKRSNSNNNNSSSSSSNILQQFRLPSFLCRIATFFRPLLLESSSNSNSNSSGTNSNGNLNYRGRNIPSSGNSSAINLGQGARHRINNMNNGGGIGGNMSGTNTPERLVDGGYGRGLFSGFGGYAGGRGRGGALGGEGGGGGFPNLPQIPPSEENIVTLVNLGFERSECIRALEQSGNNLEAAANRLLR